MKKYIWFYVLVPVLGLPTIGGAVFYATTPSPQTVCEKTLSITAEKTAEEATLTECAKALAQERDFNGVRQYRKEARCIADAETKKDLQVCAQEAAEYERSKK
jgi:hypothetical protein